MKHENFKNFSSESGACWGDLEVIKNGYTIKRINHLEDDNYSGGGITLMSDGTTSYVDDSDTHTIIFGSTGSRKSRVGAMVLPNILAMAGESFIVTDPKGELYHKTSGLVAAKGYQTIVLNFRNLEQSDFWNPIALPYELYHSGKTEEAIALINDLITTLAAPQKTLTRDTYFIDLACSQALANMLFFIDTATPEEANLYSFANFFAATCTVDQTQKLADCVAEGSIASINYKSVLTNASADRTFANVASCVSLMLNPFIVRKSLSQILSRSSFDIGKIGSTKTAIYMIIPDEKNTLHFLATIFIKQIYEALVNQAQQQKDTKLPVRLNFILDEFCNIPTIPEMSSMISAARSRNMRFFLMVQGMRQLEQKYGKGDAYTIRGNCDNWIFLTSREYSLLDELSKLCGDRFITQLDGSEKTRPLISISELQLLKKGREYSEALIFHGRNHPFVTELPDIDQYKFKYYPPIEMNKHKLPQVTLYNANKVTEEIRNKLRPIVSSVEVYGEEKYWEKPTSKSVNLDDDIFDW
jgi:type IV secretion system protein VirD4